MQVPKNYLKPVINGIFVHEPGCLKATNKRIVGLGHWACKFGFPQDLEQMTGDTNILIDFGEALC